MDGWIGDCIGIFFRDCKISTFFFIHCYLFFFLN